MRDESATAAGRAAIARSRTASTTGVQSLRRLLVANRNNRPVAVDVHTVPVVGPDGTTARRGDAAARRLGRGLARRALPEPARTGHEGSARPRWPTGPSSTAPTSCSSPRTSNGGVPCSLIICDIDHFKIDQRHLRPPGRRRRARSLWPLAQERLPPRRPGGPLRRRGIRRALRRLQQRGRRAPGRAAAQDRSASCRSRP